MARPKGNAEGSLVHVVGSGPNGLAAALLLQLSGVAVRLHERLAEPGGGLLTRRLPDTGHECDVCAGVHPLAVASPFFRALRLDAPWIHPPAALAHPFDDGTAVLLGPDLLESAAQLGEDRDAYARLLRPLAARWDVLAPEVLAPPHLPEAPVAYARFARLAVRSAAGLALARFRGARARALFAGLAAHGTLPLERARSAAFGLVLAICAHTTGWPLVRGGSGVLAAALLERFRRAGGELRTGHEVVALQELEDARAVLLDVSPRALLRLAGDQLDSRERTRLQRFPYGCGVHRVDWILSQPIPWRAAECGRAGTVHLGGSMMEIAAGLRAANVGRPADRPFVLLGQPTQFDGTRAPAGEHHAWAYCTVPLGSTVDHTGAIEAQVERFAPGFRDVVASRHPRTASGLEQHNPNLVGGSLAGGVHSPVGFFFGPLHNRSPYRTPLDRVYLCSAVTPPGPGVHGMCGYHAARVALQDLGGARPGLYPRHHLSIL